MQRVCSARRTRSAGCYGGWDFGAFPLSGVVPSEGTKLAAELLIANIGQCTDCAGAH